MSVHLSGADLPTAADVVVIGSGAAGMATAITAAFHGARVVVLEKADKFGGTTARSGGWLWIPGTPLAAALGIDEPAGAARDYIAHEATTHFDAERTQAFLENGARAVEFFARHTQVQFDMPRSFPDYHAEARGGRPGGRSMVTRPYDGRELGDAIAHLAPALPELMVLGMMLASGDEIRHFTRAFRSLASFRYVAARLLRQARDVLRHGRGMTLTNGNALAARLARSALDLDVPIHLRCRARSLLVENGRVAGVRVDTPAGERTVRAHRGVVLACGGFPHDPARQQALFPHVARGQGHYSPSPATNTGDGLALAEALGVRVDATIPHAAAWTPVSRPTRRNGEQGVMPHFIDRAKPGVIAVTRQGRRFVNESLSYHDFAIAMMQACQDDDEATVWLLCDHATLRRYGLGRVAPFPVPYGSHLRAGYLRRAPTIAALAGQIGVDPRVLAAEVERFNRDARNGADTAFGKGTTAYNRFQGDALHGPNPCLAPLEQAPYYAIQLFVGDIGTFAGLPTDAHGQVLYPDRRAVDGLYAVGNDAASIMGGNYPGAGITLGPALTFGYVLGRHLGQRQPEARAAEPAMPAMA
ncbi:FAD-dependent oxidoreductase [Bordetella genomosp. 6]|uniref:FAD-dependent oxidoreductase n=1 Tax=Bordetella genomosp. 6 TaxID=463024 RepID=UPI000A292556|nr:FAD-dependent oxidoreductase [Bordetella genomosp. 6]ARP74880.1 3-oxosteroid 1-dehydrogenase [Bordetella genomosp. 6]